MCFWQVTIRKSPGNIYHYLNGPNRRMHFTLTLQSIYLFAITSLLRWCQLTLCLEKTPLKALIPASLTVTPQAAGMCSPTEENKQGRRWWRSASRRRVSAAADFLTRHRCVEKKRERSYWRMEDFFSALLQL